MINLQKFKIVTFIFISIMCLATPVLNICQGNKMAQSDPKRPVYIQYVDEITNNFIQEAKSKLGLICWGRGGSMPHDVKSIEVAFICYQHGAIDKARALEVETTEMLIKLVNEHEKIRPFLHQYPFPPDSAEVLISFRKPNEDEYQDGSVALTFQVRNIIFYKAANQDDLYTTLAEEPYAEAWAKVLGQTENRNNDKTSEEKDNQHDKV
jgi:hypothetical protein